jgi:hypothetical protein
MAEGALGLSTESTFADFGGKGGFGFDSDFSVGSDGVEKMSKRSALIEFVPVAAVPF